MSFFAQPQLVENKLTPHSDRCPLVEPVITPSVFRAPRIWFSMPRRDCSNCWRDSSIERMNCASIDRTRASRYQPMRTRSARPRASLRSFLLRFIDSTRCAWRLSRQITGKPSCAELAPQPGRGGTTLKAKALETWRMLGEALGDHLRIGGHQALEYNLPGVIDDADGCLLQRHVETGIGLAALLAALFVMGCPPGRINERSGEHLPGVPLTRPAAITPCDPLDY